MPGFQRVVLGWHNDTATGHKKSYMNLGADYAQVLDTWLACVASTLPLRYDNQTTTSPQNPLYALHRWDSNAGVWRISRSLHYSKGNASNLVAAVVWGEQWVSSTVLWNSGNKVVVAVLQSCSAKDKKLAHICWGACSLLRLREWKQYTCNAVYLFFWIPTIG